jgi:hypothetical protein
MSNLQSQIDVAYNICPSDELHIEYIDIKNKLEYLSSRFEKIISNSRKANRGVSKNVGTEHKGFSNKSYSNFMKQVQKQRDIERRHPECQSSI